MALTGYSIPRTCADDDGNKRGGVTLAVTGPNGYSGTVVSDVTTGSYQLGPLPIGSYTVTLGSRSVTFPVLASSTDVQTAYDNAEDALVLASAAETPAGATAKAAAAQAAAIAAAAADATAKVAAQATTDSGTYATKAKSVARRLLTSMHAGTGALPAVNPAPPTITYGTARTLSTRLHQPIYPQVRNIGGPVTFDGATAKIFPSLGAGASTAALDFWVTDSAVEIPWYTQQANGEAIWVWVDGQPVTAAPAIPGGGAIGATTVGQLNTVKLVWGSVGRRRVTVYGSLINGWGGIGTNMSGAIHAAPRRLRVAFVGDSWTEMNTGGVPPIQSLVMTAGFALDVEVMQRGIGGTGYTTASNFGSATRVAQVAAAAPDLVVFVGSVNDNVSGLQAAATACYDAYAAALPGVPFIVLGPQPTNATDTISATRQGINAAVKAAATAHASVLAFHDMIGHADALPAAYNSGTTYSTGTKITHLGSVWELNNGASTLAGTAPGATSRWRLLTWALVGTGKVGTTTADGSRDLLLSSDGVHPSAAGADFFGLAVTNAITDTLATVAGP